MVSRAVAILHFLLLAFPASTTPQDRPPNILFAIADDWGWPHNSSRSPSAGKRPAEELYDLRNDPGQLDNIASDPAFADPKGPGKNKCPFLGVEAPVWQGARSE